MVMQNVFEEKRYKEVLDALAILVHDHYYYDSSDGELLDLVYEILDEAGFTKADGVTVKTNFLTILRGNSARWEALDVATACGGAWCAACELVGVETEVNIGGGAVVPWDVMGDSRPFAFVCDECAEHSEEVL